MKRFKAIRRFVFAFLLLLSTAAFSQNHPSLSGGAGTQSAPYKIANPDDLVALSGWVSSGGVTTDVYYIQVADINMNGRGLGDLRGTAKGDFLPIGIANPSDLTDISKAFLGKYDGNGFMIGDIAIKESTGSYLGIFGFVGKGAEISNVSVINALVEGKSSCGILVGCLNGKVQNCITSGKVSCSDVKIGGIAGEGLSYSSVESSLNLAMVESGGGNTGGIIGNMGGSTKNCFNSGYVKASGNSVGGIVGYSKGSAGVISGCINVAKVVTSGLYVGGIAGMKETSSLGTCFYDKQMADLLLALGNDVEQVSYKKTTKNLSSTNMVSSLSVEWAVRNGYYPQIAYFVNSGSVLQKSLSALAATPIFLLDNGLKIETSNGVESNFNVPMLDGAGGNLIWTPSDEMIVGSTGNVSLMNAASAGDIYLNASNTITSKSVYFKNIYHKNATTLTLVDGLSSQYNGSALTYPSGNVNCNNPENPSISWEYSVDNGVSWISGMPRNAGTYKIRATSSETANYAAAFAVVSYTISKAGGVLTIQCSNFTYNGNSVPAPVVTLNTGGAAVRFLYKLQGDSDALFSSNSPVDAGTYIVRATAPEGVNYLSATTDGTFSISKANGNLSISCASYTYDGVKVPQPLIVDNKSGASVAYSFKQAGASDATYSATVPKNAGSYVVKGVSAETNNYFSAAATANFNILRALVQKPVCTKVSFDFNGIEQQLEVTSNSLYTVTGGKAVNAGSYTATIALNDKINSSWDDGSVSDVQVSWTVNKLKVTKPLFSSAMLTYNGTEQSAGIAAGVFYSVTNGTAVNAGNYTATVSLNSKKNMCWSDDTNDDINVGWSIAKAGCSMNLEFNSGNVPVLKVKLVGVSGGDVLMGGVSIADGGATLNNSFVLTNGAAEQTLLLQQGRSYDITATYQGDNNHLGTTSGIKLYAISYRSNGGTLSDATYHYDGANDVVLPAPAGSAFKKFDGWYDNEQLAGARFTQIDKGYVGDILFYAKWVADVTDISVIKLWDNVLTVTNSKRHGEIESASYKWYKDGVLLDSRGQYIYFKEAIPAGTYTVEIYIGEESPLVLSYRVDGVKQASAYPNPLVAGSTLTVDVGESLAGNEAVYVFNQLGTPVAVSVTRCAESIKVDGISSAGVYFVRLAKGDGQQKVFKVIVAQ